MDHPYLNPIRARLRDLMLEAEAIVLSVKWEIAPPGKLRRLHRRIGKNAELSAFLLRGMNDRKLFIPEREELT